MTLLTGQRRQLALTFGMFAVALTASGCGSGSPRAKSSSTAAAAAAAAVASTTSSPPPVRHLRIVAPRSGARTGQTVTVHVVLAGAVTGRSNLFRYVLDGGRASRGSGHLTFRGLTAGRHHLEVALANDPSVRAHAVFVVSAPPRTVSPAPVPTTQTTPTQAPPTAPPTGTSSASRPPPATTTHAPAPAPARAGSIPQGPTAGDRDSDNSGGPSDGDGNI